MHGSLFGTAFGGANEAPKPLIGDVFVVIPCTLKEFYNGCIKTLSYVRNTLALDGHTVRVTNTEKKVIVKPGYSTTNNLTFKGEGHEQYRQRTTDLIVSFSQVTPPNNQLLSSYLRRGHDLIYTSSITL